MNYFFIIIIIYLIYISFFKEAKVCKELREKVPEENLELLCDCYSMKKLNQNSYLYNYVEPHEIKFNNLIIGSVFTMDNNLIDTTPNLKGEGIFMSHLCIDKNHRKKGFGKKLVKDVINNIKNKKKNYIILLVEESNKAAINLYESLGFIKYKKGYTIYFTRVVFYVKYL